VALGAALTALWIKWDTVWGWMAHHKAFAIIAGVTLGLMAPFLAVAVGLEALAKKWHTVWSTIARVATVAALTIAIDLERYLLIPALDVFSAIVHGAAAAFGWVPKIGPQLKAARSAFDDFRKGVDKSLHGLQVQLDTANAIGKLHNFRAQLALLHDKTISIQTYVSRVITPDVRKTYSQHAAGGKFTEGWNLYGERGPEWAYKQGATVQMYPTGTGGPSSIASPVVMPSGGGGATIYVTVNAGIGTDVNAVGRGIAGALEKHVAAGGTVVMAKGIR
jgi:hypothetical protein